MASTGQSTGQVRQAQDVDAIPTLAWAARPDGSAEFLNRRWLDYTGLSTEEASDWGWAAALHTEDRDRLLDFWRCLLASGEAGEIEARLRRYDGEYRWFLFRVEPVRDNHGGILKWYGANTDIEDRKRAEALLAAEKRTLEMIANGACLADILERLCETIDAQASNIKSAVMLMDADGIHLRPAAGPRLPKGWVEAITPLKIGPCVGSCGAAASLKQRVIVSDISTDPLWADYRDLALSHGLRAAWSQPLLSKNQEILGTFCVSYAEPRTPNDTDLRLIEGAGHIAVIAIEGERSQEALRSAFEEIRNSEARLRKIIDTIPTLAWCSLADGTGIFWNRRWHEYTGLSLEVVRGWGWQDAIHPKDLKEITDKWRGFLASGQAGEVEGRLRRFDGVYRWFLFRAEPLRDESGNIVNWYGTDTDIEDLKRAEAKLRRDEEELRRMTDAIPQTIIVLNPDGKAIYVNRVALEYTGLSLDDVQGDDFYSCSWSTRRSLGCNSTGMSPTSSRNSVPLCASSNLPIFCAMAPVNAPLSWPNNSLLQGLLVGQWAAELKSSWREAHQAEDTRKCIVELTEVTSIDRNGEAVLTEIMGDGAQFIASDVYTKHLLRNLRSEMKHSRMKGKQDDGNTD